MSNSKFILAFLINKVHIPEAFIFSTSRGKGSDCQMPVDKLSSDKLPAKWPYSLLTG